MNTGSGAPGKRPTGVSPEMNAGEFSAALGKLLRAYLEPSNTAVLSDALGDLIELQMLFLDLLSRRSLDFAMVAHEASVERLLAWSDVVLAELDQEVAALGPDGPRPRAH